MKPLFDFTDKPNQRAFFYDTGRVTGYWGGYGNGKTYAACGKGWMLSEMIPNNVGLVGRKTYPALNSTTRETFLTIARARNGGTLEPGQVIESFNKAENIMILKNGSKIFFRTLDTQEKLKSLNLGWAVVDQGEEVAYEIFLELNGRMRYWNPERIEEWTKKYGEDLKKRLGYVPKPYNQLTVVGNPAPNWAKDEFGPDRQRPHVYYASSHENEKYLPVDYISDLEKQFPKEWVARYIQGDWETFGGQVYKEFRMAVHAVPFMPIPSHWLRYVGWDHGHTNATAIEFMAVDEEGNIVLYKEHYKSGITVEEHAEAFRDLAHSDYIPKSEGGDYLVHMDPSTRGSFGPGEMSVWDAYQKHGIYGLNANNDVDMGISWMQSLIHPDPARAYPKWHPKAGQMGSPRFFVMLQQGKAYEACCPNFVNECITYEYEEVKPGQNKSEKPKKFKDHAMDAGRYGCMAVKDARAERVKPPEAKDMEREARRLDYIFTQDADTENTEYH